MSELELDKIIDALGSDSVGKNADSLLGLLQNANKLIGELDKILVFANKLEGNIILSTVVKMKAKAAGIELTPLSPGAREGGIIPASEQHKQILENVNRMSPAQIAEMVKALSEYDERKKLALEEAKPEKEPDINAERKKIWKKKK